MTTRLIIDTDPGVDDAHAILLAFAHPDARVEALTTVAGNAALEQTTRNACTILEVLGRAGVPVYAGCDRPLLGGRHDAAYVHGSDGLGDSGFPPPRRGPADEHAVHALIRLASQSPGEITLCAIGPLTNLALAVRLDPGLPGRFRRLVVMGGAIRGMGNMAAAPSAEFNVWSDPEAAAIVLDAWPGLDLISWETTVAHGLDEAQIAALMSVDTPRGEFFRRITGPMLAYVRDVLRQPRLFAPDSLAVAAALEPGIVLEAAHHPVQVELAGAHTRGQTTVDWHGLTGRPPNARLVLAIDRGRFWDLLRASLA